MTTIVYRDGILAGDQRSTNGTTILPVRAYKVRKNSKGWMYGCCGTSGPICEFEEWMDSTLPEKFPNKKAPRGDYRAIVVSPGGLIFDVDKGLAEPLPADTPFYAIGSGEDAAYGALHHGATAVEAVEIAIKVDSKSGGSVDWVSIKEITNVSKDAERPS